MDGFCERLMAVALDEQTAAPAAKRGEGDEEKEPPVPPSVEQIGDRHDKEVLPSQTLPENEPVEQENDGQEYRKFYRIEQHSRRQISGGKGTIF